MINSNNIIAIAMIDNALSTTPPDLHIPSANFYFENGANIAIFLLFSKSNNICDKYPNPKDGFINNAIAAAVNECMIPLCFNGRIFGNNSKLLIVELLLSISGNTDPAIANNIEIIRTFKSIVFVNNTANIIPTNIPNIA